MAGGWRGRGNGDALQQWVAAGREGRLLRPAGCEPPARPPGRCQPPPRLPKRIAGGLRERLTSSPAVGRCGASPDSSQKRARGGAGIFPAVFRFLRERRNSCRLTSNRILAIWMGVPRLCVSISPSRRGRLTSPGQDLMTWLGGVMAAALGTFVL